MMDKNQTYENAKKVISPNKKRASSVHMPHHHKDRYDECRRYTISIWDTKTRKEVAQIHRKYQVRYDERTQEGEPIKELSFSKGSSELRINDGKKGNDRINIAQEEERFSDSRPLKKRLRDLNKKLGKLGARTPASGKK